MRQYRYHTAEDLNRFDICLYNPNPRVILLFWVEAEPLAGRRCLTPQLAFLGLDKSIRSLMYVPNCNETWKQIKTVHYDIMPKC